MRAWFYVIIAVAAFFAAGAMFQRLHKAGPIMGRNQSEPLLGNKSMKIQSPAFSDNGVIPSKYTCDGDNANPPLVISGVPTEAKSLALIMEDPDVPKSLRSDGMFDHWVVWNIPPGTTQIPENTAAPGVQGNNGSGKPGYTGPCPPDREHRYFFKLYALDRELSLAPGSTKAQLEMAINDYTIARAELMGKYDRPRK